MIFEARQKKSAKKSGHFGGELRRPVQHGRLRAPHRADGRGSPDELFLGPWVERHGKNGDPTIVPGLLLKIKSKLVIGTGEDC